MFSLEEGKKLVKAARKSVVSKLKEEAFELEGFEQKRGVFVTIHTHPDNGLRGCIGFPEPIFNLGKAVVDSARAAAFSDPRFGPLKESELSSIIFEISVLTEPERINVDKFEDYKKEIKIGEDGLVVESNGYRGLLLPQVAPEHGMDWKEFLGCACEKAGLNSDAWKDIEKVIVYKFQAQIFKESEPEGDILETKSF